MLSFEADDKAFLPLLGRSFSRILLAPPAAGRPLIRISSQNLSIWNQFFPQPSHHSCQSALSSLDSIPESHK
jgi:hypothetical protein